MRAHHILTDGALREKNAGNGNEDRHWQGGHGPGHQGALAEYGAVYLAAVGGAGALCATRIISRRVIAWDHLGPEAVSLLVVQRLPVFVAWDLHGGNIYEKNTGD